MGDCLAAKLGDKLEHSSWIADFVSGLVKGAIYAGVAFVATTAIGLTGGLAFVVGTAAILTTGFVVGDVIDNFSDAVGDFIGELFGGKNLDGEIITGSPNVKIKGKKAARAAGKPPLEQLAAENYAQAQDDSEPENPYLNKAKEIADRILKVASFPLVAAKAAKDLIAGDNKAAPQQAEDSAPSKGFFASVADNLLAPTVASAMPGTTPADMDKITCEKWHYFSDELYLAEGSKSVFINSQPACRNGDRSTCEAKISHEQSDRLVKIGGESVVVRDIKSGKNPIASFIGETIGSMGSGLLRCSIRTFGCILLNSAVFGVVGTSLFEAISRATSSQHPVHFTTGAKLLAGAEDCDFELAGRIPLFWQRLYHSRNHRSGVLGVGWTLPFEITLRIEPNPQDAELDNIIYTDYSGRELGLGHLELGQYAFYVDEGFRLYRSLQNIFMLETTEGDYFIFEADPHQPNHLRLYKKQDRHENSLSYVYDAQGCLTHIHDDNHDMCIRLSYQAPEHTQVTAPLSTQDKVTYRLHAVYQQSTENKEHERLLVRYVYNDAEQLIAVYDAQDYCLRTFCYDEQSGLMSAHRYATGLTSHYRWQRQSEPDHDGGVRWTVSEQWLTDESDQTDTDTNTDKVNNARQEYCRFEYDLAAQTLILHQEGLGISYRQWDELGQITAFTDVDGSHWQFTWNDKSALTGITDAEGGQYHFSYDEYGNLEVVVNPLGEETGTSWDTDFFVPLNRRYPNGAYVSYEYNDTGDLITFTDPKGGKTCYRYNEWGDPIEEVDALGNHTYYDYTASGQLKRFVDCSGYSHYWYYDEWGRPKLEQNAQGENTHYHYSVANRLTMIERVDGSCQQYIYNQAGLVKAVHDFDGTVTRYHYNGRGQLQERLSPDNKRLRYHYDGFGRLVALYNEKDEAYRFSYDINHQLISSTDLTGQRKCYDYDRLGRVIRQYHYPHNLHFESEYHQESHLNPIIYDYQYDSIGRLTRRRSPDYVTEYHYQPNQATLTRSGLYDWATAQLAGQTVSADKQQTLSFTTDELGLLIAEQNHEGLHQYSYDALGNVINHTLPDGNQLGYLYYGSGHLSQLNFKTPTAMYDIAEYERDRLHREISRRQGKLTQRITFDALGQMTSKRTAFNDLGSHALPLIDKRFDYDKVGNLIQQVNGYGNYPAQTLDSRARYSQRYEYDAAQQVVMQREYTDQQHFVYDPAGNLFNEQGDVCRANQLRQYNGYHYDYDGFGRLIKRQRPAENITQWFSYNHEHQLIEARVESLQHRSITRYQYDALGRRINKTTEHYDKYSQRYTTTGTDFSWQGMRLSGEANAQQQIRYLYNGQDYEPIARVISDRHPKTSDVHYQIEYFHTLANSLPTELTNEEGEIIWLGEYTLFGQLKHQRNRDRWYSSDKTEQNLRFAGQYYDQETGLHYNTLRYYDPNCGRFTQQDPIGLAGGINLYQYAPNTLSWIDPWGLACTPKVTRGAQNQPLSAEVTIGKADIRTGTATNPSSRAWARALGNSNDDAGHILGRILGGLGIKDNVFPQLSSINRGKYRAFEKLVKEHIESTGNNVNLKWRFIYGNGGTRPTGIVYEVFDNGEKVLFDIFKN